MCRCFIVYALCVLALSSTYKNIGDRPAKLRFLDSRIVEFGDIVQGDTATVDVRFTNDGSEDLVIYKVEKTCNCTKVTLTKHIIPYDTIGCVKMRISTIGKQGPQTVVLKLLTNGENEYYLIRVNLNVLKQ